MISPDPKIHRSAKKKRRATEPAEHRPLDIAPRPRVPRPRNPEHPRPAFGLARPWLTSARPVPTAEPDESGITR